MKNTNNIWLLVIGTLLFLISYSFDNAVNLFFKNLRFPSLDFMLSIVTNFGLIILMMFIIQSILLYNKKKRLVYFLLLISVVLSLINFGFYVFTLIMVVLIESIILFMAFKNIHNKNNKLVYLLLVTFGVSFVLSFIIKLIVLRLRPIQSFTFPFISVINYSFPSMHAMIAFSLLPIIIK